MKPEEDHHFASHTSHYVSLRYTKRIPKHIDRKNTNEIWSYFHSLRNFIAVIYCCITLL